MTNQPIYVIDTNILVDYPDIIPAEGQTVPPKESMIDLTGAHIVIPEVVVRELSSFKEEGSERGKTAREVLRRLRAIEEKSEAVTAEDNYYLIAPTIVGTQMYSIFPVHKDFAKCLPFSPAKNDNDGQIILAAIAVNFVVQGLDINGTVTVQELAKWRPSGRITLLSNDNGLAIRARQLGLTTARYGYKPPAPYTGRREVIVPSDILVYFNSEQKIEMDIWREMVSSESEREMVANEFIIMRLDGSEYEVEDNPNSNSFFSYIGRYDAEMDAILPLNYAMNFPERIMNEGQAIYAEALMNPDIAAVICVGPAGSGKTYMATAYGYYACWTGQYIGVTVVPCTSQSRIGALPGSLNEKMDLDVQPLKNALRNFLIKNDRVIKTEMRERKQYGTRQSLTSDFRSSCIQNSGESRSLSQELRDSIDTIWDTWFSNLPIGSARGRDFSFEVAIYDEFQDQSPMQADTLIKRLGTDGKIILTGDIEQIHAPYLDAVNNGLVYASELLYDNPMVAQVQFIEEEVVRHPLVKMVVERQKEKQQVRTDSAL